MALGGAGGMFLGMGVGRFSYTAILPAIIESGQLTEFEAGLVGGLNLAGFFVGAFFAEMLRRAIAAAPEDPHRFRHLREQAVIHFMAGERDAAPDVANRLVQQAPGLARNKLVLASLAGIAGDPDAARSIVVGLLAEQVDLTVATMRPIHVGDADDDVTGPSDLEVHDTLLSP